MQVVPAAKGANAGIGGAFDIASADGMPDTLRTDGVEDHTTENRAPVRKHKVAFIRVRGDVLSRDVWPGQVACSGPMWTRQFS